MRRAFVLALLLPALAAAAGLTPSEERGRRIYRDGVSPAGGEITAGVGAAGAQVPAAALPCGNCHGQDGRGRPEGGVSPSDLTWRALSRPVESAPRSRPAYDDRLLKRAIAMGLDSGGRPLHVAMPRFRMSQEDMADLIAYMKRLGDQPEPGVSGAAVRIGVVLPPSGREKSGMGPAVQAALAARFEEANRKGGLWGRRIELRAHELAGAPDGWPGQVRDFLQREEVFAVAAAFLLGADRELAAVFAEAEVPLVGPFALHPREEVPPNRQVFYLLPGIEEQGRALAAFARERLSGIAAKPAIAAPEGADLDAAVRELEKALAARGAAPSVKRYPRSRLDPRALAQQLAESRPDAVFFLGSGAEAAALLGAAQQAGWQPHLFATGLAADAALFAAPAGFDGRLFVAVPSPPGAPEAFLKLAEDHGLPDEHRSAQIAALAAAEILLQGLERSGRDLTREGLIARLEGLRAFRTAFTQPVTYGPGQRLGTRGACILKADLAGRRFQVAEAWINPR